MGIIGIVGLSGSGKSSLVQEYIAKGHHVLDDIGIDGDWAKHARTLKSLAEFSREVVVCDILFCCATSADVARIATQTQTHFPGRQQFERNVGHAFKWVFFENDPWKCAKNCLWRKMYEKPERDLNSEIALIGLLSPLYSPPAPTLPVFDRK